jgi:hypothetical protein
LPLLKKIRKNSPPFYSQARVQRERELQEKEQRLLQEHQRIQKEKQMYEEQQRRLR